MAALVGLLRFEIETYMVLMANRAAIHENLPVRPSTIKRPKPLIKMSSWADNGKVEYEPRSIETGVRKLVAMKCVKKFGIVVGAVAMLAVCRPASATDILFGFTAGQLENAINSDPGFGGGSCASQSTHTASCGIFDITLTANIPSQEYSMTNPSPAPSALWETYVWTAGVDNPPATTTADGVDFYADMTDRSDPLISFITTNANTVGKVYTDVLNTAEPSVTGATPLTSNTLFTFVLNTSDATTIADKGYNVDFTLTIDALPLLASGADNGNVNADGKFITDTSITDFQMTAPEPGSGLLCLIGLAAWGFGRMRRPALRRGGRLAEIADRFRRPGVIE